MKIPEQLEKLFRQPQALVAITKLFPFMTNAIIMDPVPKDDRLIAVGKSKLGGCPDLPPQVEWSCSQITGKPLSFICQINFAETKPFDLHNELPDSGMLYFYCDTDPQTIPWGFDMTDADGFAVRYYDADPAQLKRVSPPDDLLEEGTVFGSAALSFHSRIELPNSESDLYDMIDIPADAKAALWEKIDMDVEDETVFKLLGHSDNIQGGMEFECEVVANGISAGDPGGYGEAERLGLRKNASRWMLLLQIDSDDELGMMWGDVGRLYLWIDKNDLKERRFEKAWLILQCG